MARNPIATIPFVARTIEGALRVCTGRPWHVTVVEVFDTFVNIRAVVDALATIPGGARALKGALRIGAHTEVRLAIVLVARTLVLVGAYKAISNVAQRRAVASKASRCVGACRPRATWIRCALIYVSARDAIATKPSRARA